MDKPSKYETTMCELSRMAGDGAFYTVKERQQIAHNAKEVIEEGEQIIQEQDAELKHLKAQIEYCFSWCPHINECGPVQFATCECWKGGDL